MAVIVVPRHEVLVCGSSFLSRGTILIIPIAYHIFLRKVPSKICKHHFGDRVLCPWQQFTVTCTISVILVPCQCPWEQFTLMFPARVNCVCGTSSMARGTMSVTPIPCKGALFSLQPFPVTQCYHCDSSSLSPDIDCVYQTMCSCCCFTNSFVTHNIIDDIPILYTIQF